MRPRKSLGQHFLIEPALARRIVDLARVGPGDQVVEVGAGLGSLTAALAESGARVLALEVDRALVPALVIAADATRVDWGSLLLPGAWTMVANLPYNVAAPVVMRVLEVEPRVRRMVVMVQREVGERLAAGPGDSTFGAVSLRVAYRARARVLRRVSRSVFWPQPNVDSVLVEIDRRPPPVDADPERLFALIRVAFAERRKTMRNALVRFGLEPAAATGALAACGIAPSSRPQELSLESFPCLADRIP